MSDLEDLKKELEQIQSKKHEYTPGMDIKKLGEERNKDIERQLALYEKITEIESTETLKRDIINKEKDILEKEEQLRKEKATKIIEEAENAVKESEKRMQEYQKRSAQMFKDLKFHQHYNKLFELYDVPTIETPSALTQMAEILRKIEDNKLTVEKLIQRRKRLDKQILEKTGNKGITEYTAITSLYDINKIKKYLKSEALEYDSDETGTVSPGDSSDEDLPKVTTIQTDEGDTDVKVESFMAYISRLRGRATHGNEKLYVNFGKLEIKLGEMVEVQKTLQTQYMLHKQMFDQKYTEPLKETKKIIKEYYDELEKVKNFLSKGNLMIDAGVKRENQSTELTRLRQQLEDNIKEFDKVKKTLNDVEKKLKDEKEKHKKTIEKKEKKEEKVLKLKEKQKIEKTKNENLEEEIRKNLEEEFKSRESELVNDTTIKFKNSMALMEAKWDEEKRDIRDALVTPLIQANRKLEINAITLETKAARATETLASYAIDLTEQLESSKKWGMMRQENSL